MQNKTIIKMEELLKEEEEKEEYKPVTHSWYKRKTKNVINL